MLYFCIKIWAIATKLTFHLVQITNIQLDLCAWCYDIYVDNDAWNLCYQATLIMIHTVELSVTRDSDYDFSSVRELFFGGCSPRIHQVRDMQERFPSLQEITHCMYSLKTNFIKYNCIKTNCTIVFLFHMWTYVTRHAKRPARSKFSKVIYSVDSIAVSFLIHWLKYFL